MNFFEHQVAARRSSTWLVVLFALAVLAIVAAVDLLAWVVLGPSVKVLVFFTILTLGVILLGSVYRLTSLAGGGEAVARQLGGSLVHEDTTDPDLRRLRNVVEEIAIASGVPMPALYVLEHEAAINAFAAGYSSSDAVVAVTRGALDRLNRDELQGVVAHEFSHILNGDMRLNMRLVGVLFGISMIGIIGSKAWQAGAVGVSRSGVGRPRVEVRAFLPLMAAGLAALLIGWIGLFMARIIRAGVARSRERLADASAVQFTRQTAGLAGALKKIGGLPDGSELSLGTDAEEVSHMLFGEGLGFRGMAARLFATHPPLVERIQALEPAFGAQQLAVLERRWLEAPPSGLDEDLHLGLHATGALPAAGSEQAVTAPMVAGQVGSPGNDDWQGAGAIIAALTPELRALASDRDRVVPLVLGLLMDSRESIADKQVVEIAARLGKATGNDARALHLQTLARLHPMLRMPLAELAFPVLRRRPRPDLETFLDAANAMAFADGDVSLFEYCLGRMLTVQLRESLDPARHVRFGRRKPVQLKAEIGTLLAVVAHAGHPDERAARHAYLAGLQRILPHDHVEYQPPRHGVLVLDDAWVPLDALDPLAKQLLVEAITVAVSHDGRISVAEAELLRTMCAVLHCPLPPILART